MYAHTKKTKINYVCICRRKKKEKEESCKQQRKWEDWIICILALYGENMNGEAKGFGKLFFLNLITILKKLPKYNKILEIIHFIFTFYFTFSLIII